jgi:hypothetical protein
VAGNNLMPNGATTETFSGANGAAWNATNWTTALNQGSGGGLTQQSGQGRIATGTASGNRTSVRLNIAARLDQEVVFDWVVPTAGSQFPFCWVRANSGVDTGSGYYVTLEAGNMELGYAETTNPYSRTALVTLTHGFTAGQVIRTRFAVFGGTGTKTLKARSWVVGTQENTGVWQISTTDNHVVNTAGVIGFTTASASSGSKFFFIDNVDVFDAETPSQKTITVGGSIGMSGSLIKTVPKTFVGSITMTGALNVRRVVVRTFTGSITMTGTLRKVPAKLLTGSITPVGTFLKVPRKLLTGSITPIGTYLKYARKRFSGSITPTGTLQINLLGRVFGVPGIVVVTVRKAAEVRARFRRT